MSISLMTGRIAMWLGLTHRDRNNHRTAKAPRRIASLTAAPRYTTPIAEGASKASLFLARRVRAAPPGWSRTTKPPNVAVPGQEGASAEDRGGGKVGPPALAHHPTPPAHRALWHASAAFLATPFVAEPRLQ